MQTNGQKINQLAEIVAKLAYFVSQLCDDEDKTFPRSTIAKATSNIGKKAESLVEKF